MNVEIIPKTKAEILQEKQREYVRKNYYKNKEKKLKSIMEHRRLCAKEVFQNRSLKWG